MAEKKLHWSEDMAGVHKFVNLESPMQTINLNYRNWHAKIKHGGEMNVPKIVIEACIGYAVSIDTLEANINISQGEQFEKVSRERYMAAPVRVSTDPEQIAKERAIDEAYDEVQEKKKKKKKVKAESVEVVEDEEDEARSDRKIQNAKDDILEDL